MLIAKRSISADGEARGDRKTEGDMDSESETSDRSLFCLAILSSTVITQQYYQR